MTAVVAAAVLAATACAPGGPGADPGEPAGLAPPVAPPVDPAAWRAVSVRGVEVQVPAAWPDDWGPVRPDCVRGGRRDPWAADVPRGPYVTVSDDARPVPMIGCSRDRRPGGPPAAFGSLPPRWWQPFVGLEAARPDLDDPERLDGRWEHRGWRLTRATVDGVQVTVLAPPGSPGLGDAVVGSARAVTTTALGCRSTSPVQARRPAPPVGAPLPRPRDVAAVAVCLHAAVRGPGLEAARRLTGADARDLVRALLRAPRGGGPDRPGACLPRYSGDRAVELRFLGRDAGPGTGPAPLAVAFVRFDSCVGNGTVTADGLRRLTRASCAPLFAEPPVTLWSAQAPVAARCGPVGR